MPRDASRPAKFPYIPSMLRVTVRRPLTLTRVGLGGCVSLTRAIESPSSSDVEHSAGDGEQDPPAVLAVELGERVRGVGREEEGGGVRARQPRVARLELGRGLAGDGGGWHDDALDEIEGVEQQGSVDWVREGEGHGGRRLGGRVTLTPGMCFHVASHK